RARLAQDAAYPVFRDRALVDVRERRDRDVDAILESAYLAQSGHLRDGRLRVAVIRPAIRQREDDTPTHVMAGGFLLLAAALRQAFMGRVGRPGDGGKCEEQECRKEPQLDRQVTSARVHLLTILS